MNIDQLTKEDIDLMSDEEVNLWFKAVQNVEAVKRMRNELRSWIDMRDVDTIKIHSKVID